MTDIEAMTEKPWMVKAVANRLSIRGFARLVGISPTTVIRYRRGEEMDMPTARKILPYMDTCPCCGATITAKEE